MPTNVRYFGEDGATPIAVSTVDLGQVVSRGVEVDTTPKKVCLENVSDRALGGSPFSALLLRHTKSGTNDGNLYVFTAEDPNGTLSHPWGDDQVSGAVTGAPEAAQAGAGGAWAAEATYGAVVTAVRGNPYGVDPYEPYPSPYDQGETTPSAEVVFAVPDGAKKWRYTWKRVVGSEGYNVYRTAVPGTYGPYSFVGHVPGEGSTTYDDDGHAPEAGAPPTENTTGATASSLFGDAPEDDAFDQEDKLIAAAPVGLAVGQQWFFYLRGQVPGNTSSLGNKRVMKLSPVEV